MEYQIAFIVYWVIGSLITLWQFYEIDRNEQIKLGFTLSIFLSALFGTIGGPAIIVYHIFTFIEKKWRI